MRKAGCRPLVRALVARVGEGGRGAQEGGGDGGDDDAVLTCCTL